MKKFDFRGNGRTYIYDLFKSWHNVLRKYEQNVNNDLPYFYIERTNIGLLSAAAHKIKALTIEEFSAEKGKGAKKYSGRADLWISFKKNHDYDFEAKQEWVSLNSKEIARVVNRTLNKSINDARKITHKSNYTVAIAFIVPFIHKLKEWKLESFSNQILNLKNHKGDFAAVHYSKKIYLKDILVDNKYYYPGIAVVGRYV